MKHIKHLLLATATLLAPLAARSDIVGPFFPPPKFTEVMAVGFLMFSIIGIPLFLAAFLLTVRSLRKLIEKNMPISGRTCLRIGMLITVAVFLVGFVIEGTAGGLVSSLVFGLPLLCGYGATLLLCLGRTRKPEGRSPPIFMGMVLLPLLVFYSVLAWIALEDLHKASSGMSPRRHYERENIGIETRNIVAPTAGTPEQPSQKESEMP